MLCKVLRSAKKADTYLYLPQDKALSELPEALQQLFTPEQQALSFWLTKDKKLARLTAEALLSHFETTGYYLQLPLTLPEQQAALAAANNKAPL